MIVLHASLVHDRLFVWGEKPPREGGGASSRRSQRSTPHRVTASPHDCGKKELAAVLRDKWCGLSSGVGSVEAMTAWLPTAAHQPVASSSLIAAPPDGRHKITCEPWLVAARILSTLETVEILCRCNEKTRLAAGVAAGHDLRFWSRAMRFAGSLVAGQQFLPGLNQQGGGYVAQWQPVFTNGDNERLVALARTMPAAARALTPADTTTPPAVSPVAILSTFITTLVDFLVREADRNKASTAGPGSGRKKTADSFDSVHDHWLHALQAPAGTMEDDGTGLQSLMLQLHDWRRPIAATTTSPFRLCFRLEEPESDGVLEWDGEIEQPRNPDTWFVRFLAQQRDDPSLLIPIKEFWLDKSRRSLSLKADTVSTREYILAGLGQASGICPVMEQSLQSSVPDGYEVDAEGAHEFLRTRAPALVQAGFGIMLPAWWTGRGTKLRLTAHAKVKSPKMQGGGLSLDEVMKFDWDVALGDERLSLKELQTLAQLKAPLVRVRGQWVEIDREEILGALRLWEKPTNGGAIARDIVKMALGAASPAVDGISFGGVEATGWVAELLDELTGRETFAELTAPQALQATLRPYQVRGYSWLCFLRQWRLGACLADDMGLGKTIQTLALIQRDWSPNGGRPTLILCPTSVVSNWSKEASRFTPELPVMVHHGLSRAKGSVFEGRAAKVAIVLSTYALLHRDVASFREVAWAGVILDEAQNIKNPETKQAKAVCSLESDYRIALTGTPVENNIGDLWSIMEFLNPGFLGSQTEFKRRFFIPIQSYRDSQAAEQLKRVTGPFILRRLKTDKTIIHDLPEKLEMKVYCTLTREQASLYAAVVKETEKILDGSEGIQRKGVVLATLSKLKQVCNHPAQFLGDNSAVSGRSGKLARLTEMLEEVLEVGDRALVFTQFREMGAILKRHFEETFFQEILFLHGAVPKKQRDRMVERFQATDKDAPVIFILSLKAGGTGLNLTRGNHVFHFDRWWNPAVENQATDRAFRIGQTKNVQVHKFLCAGTLEEKIDEMIERKKEVAGEVVGTGEQWLTELSNGELKEIFALRGEVGE